MADIHSPEQRSRNMAAIRAKDSTIELGVRKTVHRMGYRFRLHYAKLPGKPDIVLPGRQKVIFVHGCFWHMHRCRKGRSKPVTNAQLWERKRLDNVARDKRVQRALKCAGWKILVVWGCQVSSGSFESKVRDFLK